MDDGFWMLPVFFGTIFTILFILIIGGKFEANRIFDNCMENNKTMIHQDAVKLCKDIVK